MADREKYLKNNDLHINLKNKITSNNSNRANKRLNN